MRRHGLIVLAQAAVVGALLVVVYTALLAPEGDEPLFDVTLPPNPAELIPPPPGGDGREPTSGGDGREGRDDGDGPDRANPPTAAAPVAPPTPPPATVPYPEAGAETPADDQYEDAVARVLDPL